MIRAPPLLEHQDTHVNSLPYSLHAHDFVASFYSQDGSLEAELPEFGLEHAHAAVLFDVPRNGGCDAVHHHRSRRRLDPAQAGSEQLGIRGQGPQAGRSF